MCVYISEYVRVSAVAHSDQKRSWDLLELEL